MSEKVEIWKPVLGFEGSYEVSSLGRVKTLSRTIVRSDGVSIPLPEKIMKPRTHTNGYLVVSLWQKGKQKKHYVHRLVASCFCFPFVGIQVNHKDLTRNNNEYENLEWVTNSENAMHASAHGRLHAATNPKRSSSSNKNWSCVTNPRKRQKLTPEKVLNIREDVRSGKAHRAIARAYGISKTAVGSIATRKIWKEI